MASTAKIYGTMDGMHLSLQVDPVNTTHISSSIHSSGRNGHRSCLQADTATKVTRYLRAALSNRVAVLSAQSPLGLYGRRSSLPGRSW